MSILFSLVIKQSVVEVFHGPPGMAFGGIKVGHKMGPFSMMVPQFFLILAKWRLNSMPQPLERRKSTRIP